MASTTLLALTLSLLLLPSLSAASPLLDAAEILATAGFHRMALHLELASQTLQSHHSLTIFAPSDSHHHISINNVTVNPSPIFRNPHLAIFATHSFFNPHFHLQQASPPPPPPQNPLSHASRLLHSRGFTLMASILDLQFPAITDRRELTLFVPPDEAVAKNAGNLTELPALLRHHLVPRKIAWCDLASLKDGTLIGTYQSGFAVNVTKSGTHTLLLNGVPVDLPEMYRGDWLVLHGVRHVLFAHKGKRHRLRHGSDPVSVAALDGEQPPHDFDDRELVGNVNSPQHYHFSVFH
ncbi:putative fasciclin-like arabinogalactan protein 20 [Cajanus cajan]|uniref:putative fasciclin-like arabinogalactan protein 20 n=1 Tax=Cajanus cajan TaxID=3821 RepID=UPI00098DA65A|nr:putative fasciclin-like arabinogalactan protein 20 [Cajanus cajan]